MEKLYNNSCYLKFERYWKLPKTSRSQLQEILRKIQCYIKVHNSSKTQNHCSGGEQFKSQKVICLNSSVSGKFSGFRSITWHTLVGDQDHSILRFSGNEISLGFFQYLAFVVPFNSVDFVFRGSHDVHHRRYSINQNCARGNFREPLWCL